MKIILLIVLLFALCSCSLEKRVFVTARGHEQSHVVDMSDIKIKELQRTDAVPIDSLKNIRSYILFTPNVRIWIENSKLTL